MKVAIPGTLRSAITFGLILWCAGAGCLMVSVANGAARTGPEPGGADSGWEQASATMGTHDCCKARHASERRAASSIPNHASPASSVAEFEEIAEVPNSSDAMSCCPLTSGTFVVTVRQSPSHEDSSVSRGFDAALFIHHALAVTAATPPRLPNQNQTYLRGCVFLI